MRDEPKYLLQAMDQIREMGARGWHLRVEFDDNATVDDLSGSAGDCNCHHRKEYDITDGHGFSSFDCMEDYKQQGESKEFVAGPIAAEWLALTGEHGAEFTAAIAFAHRHIMAIVPGAKYDSRR